MNLKKKPQVYVMVGKPESGKSYMVKSLIRDFQTCNPPYFKFILAFVRTKWNGGYEYLPDEYVHENFDQPKLQAHIEN